MATITFGKSGTRPYCTLAVTEQSQSVANNTTTVRYVLTLVRPSAVSSSATKNWSCTINGTRHTGSGTIGGSGNKVLIQGTQVIQHNDNGTKTISFSGSCQLDITWSGVQLGTITGSGTMTLTAIPRYASVNQALSAKTETTATIKWTSDSVIDYIWYSTNNGSTWTGINVTDGTSGSYTISGLSANTTYQIKTRVRRKDTQLTTDSSSLSVETYDYPYCNSMPDFIIGSKLTLGFYNPLGRQITFYIIANGTQILNNWTIKGTSYSGVNAESSQNQLYATIPNAQTATYQVKVAYGTHVNTKTGGKYHVNPFVCYPSIGSVGYVDTNATTIAMTGNNQDIVRNKSTVQYSASGLTAQKYASIASCSVEVNGNTYNLTVSGSSASGGNAVIDSGQPIEAIFTVTDSRGLTASEPVTINMIDWHIPSAIIKIQRENNYYSETNIKADADYASINGNNSITITYQATENNPARTVISGTLQDNVTTQVVLDNEYEWTVAITITDSLGGTVTYNVILPRGMPFIFFDRKRSSVGINCFPQKDKSLEVNGYDLTFHKGETFSMSGTSQTSPLVSGVITNSTKRILFSVVLPKFNPDLTVTVQALGLNIWQNGSYVLDSSYVGSGGYDVVADNTITVSHSLVGNVITFSLDKTVAFNGTNNTSVEVQVNSMTLVFS